jgi:hypothetical protein
MRSPQPFIMWVRDRLVLSFISAWAGWGAGLSLFLITGLWTIIINSKDHLFFGSGDSFDWTYMVEGIFVIGLFMGIYVLLIWFLILVPLALLVPNKSFLWKPRTLTLCGILAGPTILVTYIVIAGSTNFNSPVDLQNLLYACYIAFVVPAAIGGVTCYVGARLNQRFLRQSS